MTTKIGDVFYNYIPETNEYYAVQKVKNGEPDEDNEFNTERYCVFD